MNENETAIINELTEALQQSNEIQRKQQSFIQHAKEENDFLSETILKNKLGKIAEERKKTLVLEASSKKAKELYEARADEYKRRVRHIRKKQAKLNEYIEYVSNKKLKRKKSHLSKVFREKESALRLYFKEREDYYQGKITIYKRVIIGLVLYAILITLICIIRG